MAIHVYIDKLHKPKEEEISTALGMTSFIWNDIHNYIVRNYDFTPELIFFTKNYGWTVRYRKNNKTLCYFFPKRGSFLILIVLGGKEANQVDLIKDRLNKNILQVFESTEQLHDGRWLWIEINNSDDIDSFKEILTIKKKPKK